MLQTLLLLLDLITLATAIGCLGMTVLFIRAVRRYHALNALLLRLAVDSFMIRHCPQPFLLRRPLQVTIYPPEPVQEEEPPP